MNSIFVVMHMVESSNMGNLKWFSLPLLVCVVVNMLLEVVAISYMLKLKLCHLTNTDISDQNVERNKEERKLWEGITWHDGFSLLFLSPVCYDIWIHNSPWSYFGLVHTIYTLHTFPSPFSSSTSHWRKFRGGVFFQFLPSILSSSKTPN